MNGTKETQFLRKSIGKQFGNQNETSDFFGNQIPLIR